MSKIEEFLDSQHNLGKETKRLYRFSIKKFEGISGTPFEKMYLDQKKVHSVLNKLSNQASVSSWNFYLTKYKRFAKWLYDPEDEISPNLWRKIKKKPIDWEEKLKDKWLTKKQFYKLLDVVDYPRDKAMYGVAVEGALRAGELLTLRIKDVTSTSYGYDITVSGKTGSSTFPVVLFAPLLTQWLNLHPFKKDLDAPLWPLRKRGKRELNQQITDYGAYKNIRMYSKRAGLKPISFHWLRHSKITWTAKDNKIRVSDEMAKKMFRWKKNSRMFSRYTHLHGVDSKDTFLALAGVETKEETEKINVLSPKKCLNCQEMNSAESLYCLKCGFVLDEEEARKLVEQKRIQDVFMKISISKFTVDKEYEELLKKTGKKEDRELWYQLVKKYENQQKEMYSLFGLKKEKLHDDVKEAKKS